MADKAVSELIEAERITATDLFVLEQNGTAKKLKGQVLLYWLFQAADGHGGIQSIKLLKTEGLNDTYRITFADKTVSDFVVTNGRGIRNIQKTSTNGLVDTYTVTYNDETTETITVTNGTKGDRGDKGDNAYVWIKYASVEPTEESNSFGSLPDDWIGIYSGPLAEAPSDWREYAWYQIKGKQGDTGAPASIVNASVAYQQGDSGTIIPSGVWSESVAVVPNGKYLWTRTTIEFNMGDPVIFYAVSRMGQDGPTGRRGNSFLLYNKPATEELAPIADFIVPFGYAPEVGDLVLCSDGVVAQIIDLIDSGAVDGTPTGIDYAELTPTEISLNGSDVTVGPQGPQGGYYLPDINVDDESHTFDIGFLARGFLDDTSDIPYVTISLPKGKDGYTPVRGTDYWTEADQEAIVQQVIAALGTPVFGRVDADNNIILTGELADGTYTLKYEDAEGNLTVIGTFDTSPGYTNMIPLSVEADDTPYNGGQGWKADTRLSSSGGESTSSATGMEVIGFVPFKRGDIIRFRDITMNPDSSNAARCYFIQYDENKTMLKQWIVSGFNDAIKSGKVLVDESGNILQINTGDFDDESTGNSFPIYTNAAYFRISADEINEHSIITINEEIPADEETYTNWLPISTDTDGRIYNGVGYKANVRLSASSGYTETAMDIGDPLYLTGYIPVKTGDVLRFYNMTISAAADENYTGRLYVYDTSKTGVETNSAIHYASVNGWNVVSENSNVTQLTYGGADGFIRINADNITAESIITINQEIA